MEFQYTKDASNLPDMPGEPRAWGTAVLLMFSFAIYCCWEFNERFVEDEIVAIKHVSEDFSTPSNFGSNVHSFRYYEIETKNKYKLSAPARSNLREGDKIRFIQAWRIVPMNKTYQFLRKVDG